MGLIIQKYGGSSVADPACMKRVAQRVAETRREGHSVVVVVSAMGKGTNQLIDLAKQVNPHPSEREMDVLLATGEQISISILAMALDVEGIHAVSMTGPQAGIRTDHMHTKAKITGIDPHRVFEALK
ncbi:MAG: aspartate kinase, partial [Kiritimatiellae bacterium]|nr:aspartate kinase [Kiritimatiellia bacterium]